jgi:hypothetical protein
MLLRKDFPNFNIKSHKTEALKDLLIVINIYIKMSIINASKRGSIRARSVNNLYFHQIISMIAEVDGHHFMTRSMIPKYRLLMITLMG